MQAFHGKRKRELRPTLQVLKKDSTYVFHCFRVLEAYVYLLTCLSSLVAFVWSLNILDWHVLWFYQSNRHRLWQLERANKISSFSEHFLTETLPCLAHINKMRPSLLTRAAHKPLIQFVGPRANLWKGTENVALDLVHRSFCFNRCLH